MIELKYQWTDARKEHASSLWRGGISASCIAEELGGITRSAVIGMMNRMGIRTPAKRNRLTPEELERRQQYKKQRRLKNRPTPPDPQPAPMIEPAPESAVTFAQLNALHCRWVIGEPNGLDTMYCGAIKADGQSYCGFHCLKAFNFDYRRVPTAKPLW